MADFNIVPPFAQKTVKVYNGRVEALASVIDFLKSQKENMMSLRTVLGGESDFPMSI